MATDYGLCKPFELSELKNYCSSFSNHRDQCRNVGCEYFPNNKKVKCKPNPRTKAKLHWKEASNICDANVSGLESLLLPFDTYRSIKQGEYIRDKMFDSLMYIFREEYKLNFVSHFFDLKYEDAVKKIIDMTPLSKYSFNPNTNYVLFIGIPKHYNLHLILNNEAYIYEPHQREYEYVTQFKDFYKDKYYIADLPEYILKQDSLPICYMYCIHFFLSTLLFPEEGGMDKITSFIQNYGHSDDLYIMHFTAKILDLLFSRHRIPNYIYYLLTNDMYRIEENNQEIHNVFNYVTTDEKWLQNVIAMIYDRIASIIEDTYDKYNEIDTNDIYKNGYYNTLKNISVSHDIDDVNIVSHHINQRRVLITWVVDDLGIEKGYMWSFLKNLIDIMDTKKELPTFFESLINKFYLMKTCITRNIDNKDYREEMMTYLGKIIDIIIKNVQNNHKLVVAQYLTTVCKFILIDLAIIHDKIDINTPVTTIIKGIDEIVFETITGMNVFSCIVQADNNDLFNLVTKKLGHLMHIKNITLNKNENDNEEWIINMLCVAIINCNRHMIEYFLDNCEIDWLENGMYYLTLAISIPFKRSKEFDCSRNTSDTIILGILSKLAKQTELKDKIFDAIAEYANVHVAISYCEKNDCDKNKITDLLKKRIIDNDERYISEEADYDALKRYPHTKDILESIDDPVGYFKLLEITGETSILEKIFDKMVKYIDDDRFNYLKSYDNLTEIAEQGNIKLLLEILTFLSNSEDKASVMTPELINTMISKIHVYPYMTLSLFIDAFKEETKMLRNLIIFFWKSEYRDIIISSSTFSHDIAGTKNKEIIKLLIRLYHERQMMENSDGLTLINELLMKMHGSHRYTAEIRDNKLVFSDHNEQKHNITDIPFPVDWEEYSGVGGSRSDIIKYNKVYNINKNIYRQLVYGCMKEVKR